MQLGMISKGEKNIYIVADFVQQVLLSISLLKF